MNNKILYALIALIFVVLIAAAVQARVTKDAAASEESQGIGGRFFEGVACLFKCGWPAWLIIILPPVAVWFYKRYINWGG